jgi:hypothetical protein
MSFISGYHIDVAYSFSKTYTKCYHLNKQVYKILISFCLVDLSTLKCCVEQLR